MTGRTVGGRFAYYGASPKDVSTLAGQMQGIEKLVDATVKLRLMEAVATLRAEFENKPPAT